MSLTKRAALPRRPGRHRDRQRRPLPSARGRGRANRQNETLQHSTTIYLHPNVAEYAEKLAAKMPGDLKVCYFVNSGSEANDLALLMARAYTGNYDVIALRNGYHGGNMSAMGLTAHSTWKFNVPHSFGVHHALAPDPYRGVFGYDRPGRRQKIRRRREKSD
jgi:alanine-glyoxylate transaminase / (R)-3-amino-2-methylpropionate-pyruvate transaminase